MKGLTVIFVVLSILIFSPLAIAVDDTFKIRIVNPKDGSVVKKDYVVLRAVTSTDTTCEYSKGFGWREGRAGGGGAGAYNEMEKTGKRYHAHFNEGFEETINNKERQEHYFLDVRCTDKFGNQVRARTTFTVNFPN